MPHIDYLYCSLHLLVAAEASSVRLVGEQESIWFWKETAQHVVDRRVESFNSSYFAFCHRYAR
jgi:hypothetical protein